MVNLSILEYNIVKELQIELILKHFNINLINTSYY